MTFLALVLAILLLRQYRKTSLLLKESAEHERFMVRFQQVNRWCASIACSPVDVHCFIDYQLTTAMAEWQKSTGKDPLIIEHFREYALDRQAGAYLDRQAARRGVVQVTGRST